jgi:hypothetical protein
MRRPTAQATFTICLMMCQLFIVNTDARHKKASINIEMERELSQLQDTNLNSEGQLQQILEQLKEQGNKLKDQRQIAEEQQNEVKKNSQIASAIDGVLGATIRKGCPLSFEYIYSANLCFKIISTPKKWNDTRQDCMALHPSAGLIGLIKKEEHEALQKFLQALPKEDKEKCLHGRSTSYATSMQRKQPGDCSTLFVSRPRDDSLETEVTEAQWCPKEPNCANSESCVFLDSDCGYGLYDYPCETPTCSICQIVV